jgi:hypothetical protein
LLRTNVQELTGDWQGYGLRSAKTSVAGPSGTSPTQKLGAALFASPDLEGFMATSARVPYSRSLVVFPEKLRPGSWLKWTHPLTGKTSRIP